MNEVELQTTLRSLEAQLRGVDQLRRQMRDKLEEIKRHVSHKPLPPGERPIVTGDQTGLGPWAVYNIQEDDWKLEDVHLLGERRLIVEGRWYYPEPQQNLSFKRCTFEGQGELMWAMRLYDQWNLRIENCEFRDIGHFNELTYLGDPAGKWEGHCIYVNPYGDVRIHDCLFENTLGHAVHIDWRPSESALPGHPRGVIDIQDIRARNTDQHADRGSYAIHVANTGQSVALWGCVVETTEDFPVWEDSNEILRQSRGGVFVGAGKEPYYRTPVLAMYGLQLFLRRTRQPAIRLENIDDIDISTGHVENQLGNPAMIDIYSSCPKGRIRGLTTTGRGYEIRRITPDGQRITMARNEDYEWNDAT